MKYTSEDICKRFRKKEKLKYVFFRGHQPTESVTKSCFSQWYNCKFTVDGVENPLNRQGKNLLGFCLTEVRDILSEENDND